MVAFLPLTGHTLFVSKKKSVRVLRKEKERERVKGESIWQACPSIADVIVILRLFFVLSGATAVVSQLAASSLISI